MLIESGSARVLGVAEPWLRFGGTEPGEPKPSSGSRFLLVDGTPAFELSFWCGSCACLFQRLSGSNQKGSVPALSEQLAQGLDRVEPAVIDQFAPILPADAYLPMLLQIEPRLVSPHQNGDYFAHEQLQTWEVDPFWGLPQYTATPYYRTFETAVVDGTEPAGTWGDGHLYEFVVPMVPPRWNSRDRVEAFSALLQGSSAPTAVAVSLLDVCQPATSEGDDYYAHWGLTHFLLDGHHKMEAAAREGRSLRLLSLLATGASLATSDQVARVPALRAQPSSARMPQ